MIVDDEEDIRTIMKQVLASNYEVVEAFDGLDALYKMRYSEPDLIVMDVMMPLMNGFSACEAIRKDPKFSDIPVLFLSALNDRENIKQGYASGANLYLTKPFEPERVIRNIEVHFKEKGIAPRERKYSIAQLQEIFDRVKNLKERVEGADQPADARLRRVQSANAHVAAVYGEGFASVTGAAAAKRPEPGVAKGARPRVMIVDDEPDVALVAGGILQDQYEIVSAQDGIEAIERIVMFEPDLLLIDAMMPRMSGYQLVQSLRRNVRFAATHIVMMSGKSSPKDIDYARRLGVDDFVPKPFEPSHLLGAMQRAVTAPDFKVFPKRMKIEEIRERETVWERDREARKTMRTPDAGRMKKADREGELEKFLKEMGDRNVE